MLRNLIYLAVERLPYPAEILARINTVDLL